MPARSRPTIRILAEFRPPSACTSFALCTADAFPAILAGTASPTHSPPACPPCSRNSSPRNPPRLVRFPAAPGTPRCNPDPPRRPCDRTPTSNLPRMAPCLSVSSAAPWPPAYPRHNNSFSRRTKRSLSAGSCHRLSRSQPDAPGRPPQNPPRILYLPISREYRAPRRSLPYTSRRSVVERAAPRCWYPPGKLFAGYLPTHTLSSLRHPRRGHRRRLRRVPK